MENDWWKSHAKGFHTVNVNPEEIETIIKETVAQEHPGDPIKTFEYKDYGIDVILESGQIIHIEIDWEEFILS